MSPNSNEKCGKKTNLLVYQTPSGQRIERKRPCAEGYQKSYRPPICAPKPKQIRVCTGAELKKMCPPKLCPCPKERGSVFLSLLGFMLKTAVAAGAVYVSYDLGLWGTTEDTHQLYRAYCKILSQPDLEKARKWEPPSCDAEKDMLRIPKFDPLAHCENPPIEIERQTKYFQNRWNRAVQFVFGGIAGFPNNMMSGWQSKEEKKDECIKMEPDEDTGIIKTDYRTK